MDDEVPQDAGDVVWLLLETRHRLKCGCDVMGKRLDRARV